MKCTALFLLFSAASALAHHGQDFLVNYDPKIPAPWSASVFSAFEWSREEADEETSFEPGFLIGVAPNISLGTTLRIENDADDDWRYAGVNPMVQIRLPLDKSPVSIGFFAGYLFADPAPEHSHTHDTLHIHEPDPGGVDPGPDGPPPGSGTVHYHDDGGHSHSHAHTGIHRHGEDHFQFRVLLETQLWKDSRLVGNLIGIAAGGGDYAFGYSIGLRQQISHDWAVGLEGIGDFETGGEHEALAGVYWSPVHTCTIRLGAGAGIGSGSGSGDFSLHSGVTWRF